VLKDMQRYDEAEAAYRKANELDPNYGTAYYNLACFESMRNNPDAAFEHLRRAAQLPEFSLTRARLDPDFEWIRDDPRFKEIVGEDV
jgi:tetratricopeptide (TPR) repeat protein